MWYLITGLLQFHHNATFLDSVGIYVIRKEALTLIQGWVRNSLFFFLFFFLLHVQWCRVIYNCRFVFLCKKTENGKNKRKKKKKKKTTTTENGLSDMCRRFLTVHPWSTLYLKYRMTFRWFLDNLYHVFITVLSIRLIVYCNNLTNCVFKRQSLLWKVLSSVFGSFGPHQAKTCLMPYAISLCIRAVWSAPLLFTA